MCKGVQFQLRQSSGSKTINELALEYFEQYEILTNKINKMFETLPNAKGEEIFLLRKKIKVYNDMAEEALKTYYKLKNYYKTPEC